MCAYFSFLSMKNRKVLIWPRHSSKREDSFRKPLHHASPYLEIL